MSKSLWFYDCPIGTIGIVETAGAVSHVFFENDGGTPIMVCEHSRTNIIKKTAQEIAEYFAGKRKIFDVPITLNGTDFQMSVWHALLTIPAGETRSYKQIAQQIDNPNAYRAVGMANNKNPISIIVPCHRVVGQDGSLTGYGAGMNIKKYLLDLERQYA